MSNYLTVFEESQAEYVEKRSRFIATLRHTETEQEALEFIEEMRSKYWDARHNCFAFSVDAGRTSRFSDDGEPHSTAGKPILEVINGNELKNVTIVVTRYFGGVLLGTGGLVRAYSSAARDAVANAVISQMRMCTLFETECEYTDHGRLATLIESFEGEITDTIFTDKVKLQYVLTEEKIAPFLLKLSETFSARITAKESQKKLCPFKV